MVFSPDPRDLEEIALTLNNYIDRNFKNSKIEIQKFFGLSESSIKGYPIGSGGEILVVFDRRLCPREIQSIELRPGFEKEALTQLSLKMSKEYCDKSGIPYIQYEGEIRNRIEQLFVAKIDGVKNKIKKRLEENFSF